MNEISPSRNIKLVIAYNGSAYRGWQRQAEGLDTVQLRIEQAAGRIMGHPVTILGASRTDAGVHAAGQVANFHTNNMSVPLAGFQRAMNSKLPPDIAIRSACLVPHKFHSSWSATGKTYEYRIDVSPIRPVELAGRVYHYWRSLDVPAMQEAARRLIGKHDFRGLASSADARENTVRTIFNCRISQDESQYRVIVEGDGFLYKMVRNIVGTLIDIGRGRWSPERIDTILSSRRRRDAGPTAPPDGLSLIRVHYAPELFAEKVL